MSSTKLKKAILRARAVLESRKAAKKIQSLKFIFLQDGEIHVPPLPSSDEIILFGVMPVRYPESPPIVTIGIHR